MKSRVIFLQTVLICFVLCSIALGQDLASFEKRTTVKKLRRKLGEPDPIETLIGSGYRITW